MIRISGFVLLFAGWAIVLTAVCLLRAPGALGAFVAAGTAVEVLGLVFVVRSHVIPKERKS